jgi:phage-related holin
MYDVEIIIHFFKRLGEYPAVKLIVGLFFGLLRILFGTFRPVYGAVMLLWLSDTGTGFYYAWANPAQKPESRKMYHGLVKLLIYLCLLSIGYQCGTVGLLAVVQGMIESFIVLTESYSVLENVQKICILHHIDFPIVDQVMKMIQGRLISQNPNPTPLKGGDNHDTDHEGDA